MEGLNLPNRGGTFKRGFADGAAEGALWGGIFAFAGSVIRIVKITKIANRGITIGKTGTFEGVAEMSDTYYYGGLKGHKMLSKLFGRKFADAVGWMQNRSLISGVMRFNGLIFDSGGKLTGAYAREILLTQGYSNLINIWL